jgi:hypothetical protein
MIFRTLKIQIEVDLPENLNNNINMFNMIFFLRLADLLRQYNSAFSHNIFPSFILFWMIIIIYFRKFFNTFFQRLINKNVKKLYKINVFPGNEKKYNISYFKFIEYFLRFLKLKYIQNEKARLNIFKRNSRKSPAIFNLL